MHALPFRPTAHGAALWALSVLLALLLLASGLGSASSAWGARTITLGASFEPNAHLDEGASLQTSLSIAGSEYFGHADPLTSLTLHLPVGTTVTSEGFPTCSLAAIQTGEQCPVGSLAGPLGSFTAWIAFGGQLVSETGQVQAMFGPGGVLYFVAEGRSPAFVEYVMEGHIEPASPPGGPSLTLNVPLVETVPGAPSMSLTSLEVGLGTTRIEPDGSEVNSVTTPATCSGSLTWTADAGFNGEASQPVGEENQFCLPGEQRAKTTTTLAANKTVDELEETVTYTATVQPVSPGVVPSGTVTFYDGTQPIVGCVDRPVTGGASTATASCSTSYVTYAGPPVHHLTALYSGDETYRGSFSQTLTVTVGEGEKPTEPPAKEPTKETPPPTKEVSSGGSGNPSGTGQASQGSGSVGSISNPSGAVSTTQLKASLGRQLTPTGKAASIAALLKSGGYTATFTALEAGTLTVQWYELPSGAKLAGKTKAKPVLVASGRARFAQAGTDKLTLRLTTQGKWLLKHGKHLKLEAEAVFSPTGGGRVSASKVFSSEY